MKTKRTALDEIMREEIIVGGMIYTRGELAEEMRRDGFPPTAVDITCFSPAKATGDELGLYREQSEILRNLITVE